VRQATPQVPPDREDNHIPRNRTWMGVPEPAEGASAYPARARHRSTQLIRLRW
jgi:hypothetical protein